MYPKDKIDYLYRVQLFFMEIQFYLKRPDSDTETVIFARISYSGRKLKYYLPKKVTPTKWNFTTKRLNASTREEEKLNKYLNKAITDIQTVYDGYVLVNKFHPSTDTLKELLDKEFKDIEPQKQKPKDIDKRFTFFGYFEDLIEKSESGERVNPKTSKPISPNTIKTYKTTEKLLKEFQRTTRRNVDFNTIDLEFYEALKKYTLTNRYSDNIKKNKDKKSKKVSSGYSTNTIGKHIQVLKTILNEATDLGYNTNTKFKSTKFQTLREEVDTIYLTENEIQQLADLDLSNNKKYDVVRDLFLIGCYTGMAYTDYSNIRKENITGDFLKYKRQKTGVQITLYIKPELRAILEKYDYNLPKSYSNQKTNEYLKEIGVMVEELKKEHEYSQTIGGKTINAKVPKYTLLTSHTGRRSYATNEYLFGTPVLSIMATTGHKTEKSFMKYIRLTSDEHAKVIQMHHLNKTTELKKIV